MQKNMTGLSHRTCLLAFVGEVKNLQHGLADDPDRMEEREASPVTTFCVG
jgi:chorismate mutase